MSYVVWGRLARTALLLLLLPTLLGVFGGVIAFMVTRELAALAVAGAAFAYGLVMVIPTVVFISRHDRGMQRAIADRLGLAYAHNRMHGVVDGVEIAMEIVWTIGTKSSRKAMWRLLPQGAAAGCCVQPASYSARVEVEGAKILSGDQPFDQRFRVQAHNPEAALAFLDARRRLLLCQLDDACKQFWFLRADGLMVRYGLELDGDHEDAAAYLRTMAAWAKALLSVA